MGFSEIVSVEPAATLMTELARGEDSFESRTDEFRANAVPAAAAMPASERNVVVFIYGHSKRDWVKVRPCDIQETSKIADIDGKKA